jgi:replicative DNA helicase
MGEMNDNAGGNGSGRGFRDGKGARPVLALDKLFDRPPPHSLIAEMALLGGMVLEPSVIHDVISVVKSPEAFFLEAHAAIYAALLKTYDQKQTGNLALLAQELDDGRLLESVGGTKYLEKLAAETPGPATAVHFAKIVADKARLRKLIAAGGQIVYDAYHAADLGPDGSREIVDKAESLVFEIAQQEETSDAQALSVLIEQEYERLVALKGKGTSGVPTYFSDLDEMTSGLQAGDLIILAARPSMGKTALMLNLAEQIALGGTPWMNKKGPTVPVGVFSLEMSKSAIAQRLLSARSGYSSHEMRSGRLGDGDYDHICASMVELMEAPIYIDDTPGLTVLGLRTRARRLVAQHGCKVLMIDYLQLMTAPGAARESRQVEVSAISRGVKALARELNVPVICLSQLNRGPESRGDNRPRMSDLRESGSIEQDADVVVLIHREAYYHVGDAQWESENEDKLNLTELIIAKQRNGPTDVVKLTWDRATTRFKNFGTVGGGTGLPRGFTARGKGDGPPAPGSAPADPFKIEVVPFAPGKKTGPVANHRDGGGPDRDEYDDSGDVGLPV